VIWVPIVVENNLELGLWIERWNDRHWDEQELRLFAHLARGFSAAFQKFLPKIPLNPKSRLALKIFGATALLFLLFFPVSLRIAAPCEVVAKDPYLVTAPLNGIIEQILVKPGEVVDIGAVLFQYDKQVPLQDLKVAEKEAEIAKSQLTRVMTKGYDDADSLNEAGIWKLQLDRDEVKLDLARYQASKLDVIAPVPGFIALDDPEQWRGRPVQIGERVMMIVDPNNTKLKIWISESDNIAYLPDEPIEVFLNIDPATTYTAQIRYVSDYSLLSATGITSFVAEADWVEKPADVKIGLKGTAVLFGEHVPLFYWLLRKPWNTFRHATGI
jgi:multidrug resistance efflux pump